MQLETKLLIRLFILLTGLFICGIIFIRQNDDLIRYRLIMLDLREDCLSNQKIKICEKILLYK